MASVGATDGGNARGVPRSGEPVMHRGPDLPALNRRLAGAVVPGNQQKDSFTSVNRLL
jgi:hypothetical protein